MKRWRRMALVLAIGLALVAPAGCSRSNEVPNVVGMPYDKAIKTLQDEGFELGDTNYGFSNNATAGVVARQTPAAGSTLERNGKVSVLVVQPLGSLTTPELVGLTLEQAESALTTFALDPAVTEDYSTSAPKGIVMMQAPAAGTLINPGDVVAVVVSKGPAPVKVKVPELNGKSQSEAEAALKAVGLVGVAAKSYSDTVSQGVVFGQNPVAGASMSPGSNVSFEVSQGKSTQSVTVPNVVGRSQADAVSAITAAGLVPSAVYAIDAKVPQGNVVSQSPAAGAKTAKGAAIGIVVSLGADTSVVVPNVVGKTSEEASAAILAAGLKPQAATQPDAEVPKGTVITQGPAAGAKAEAGLTVLFTVSSGVPQEPK